MGVIVHVAITDHQPPPFAVTDRALIDLLVIKSTPAATVSTIVGQAIGDLPDSLAAALRRTGMSGLADQADEILREGESWFDDQTRSSCLAKITAALIAGAVADPIKPRAHQSKMTATRRRPRRWSALFATAAVGGIAIGVAVTWSSPNRRVDDDSRPTSSTPASASSAPNAAPQVFADIVPQYVLSKSPAGYNNFGVFANDGAPSTDSWIQIWAEPDATRTTGKWFSIVLARCAASQEFIQAGATRTLINGNAGLLVDNPDGTTRLDIGLGEVQTLEVSGFGLDHDTITSIAAAVELDANKSTCGNDRQPEPITVQPQFASLTNGMHMVVSEQVAQSSLVDLPAQFSESTRGIFYFDDISQPGLELASSTVDDDDTTNDIISRFSNTIPTTTRAVTSNGRTALVTEPIVFGSTTSTTLVSWSQDGLRLTMSGPFTADVLLGLIPGVHRANDAEWDALLTANQNAPSTDPTTPDTTATPHPPVLNVGTSTTTDGQKWQLLVTPGLGTLRPQSTNSLSSDIAYTFDTTKPIIRLDQANATVLVVILPGNLNGNKIQADVGGTTLPAVSLTRPTPDSPAFAIIAVSETGPLTIHILNTNGQPGDEIRNTT